MTSYRESEDVYEIESQKTARVFQEFSEALNRKGFNNIFRFSKSNKGIQYNDSNYYYFYTFAIEFLNVFQKQFRKLKAYEFDNSGEIVYCFTETSDLANYCYQQSRLREAIENQTRQLESYKTSFWCNKKLKFQQIRKDINYEVSRPGIGSSRNQITESQVRIGLNIMYGEEREIADIPDGLIKPSDRQRPPSGGPLKQLKQ